MTDEEETKLDRTLATIFAREPETVDPHPDPDQLAAYLAGESEDPSEIETHLADCRECTQRLLDLEILAHPDPPRADGAADFETAAAWQALKEDLDASELEEALSEIERAEEGRSGEASDEALWEAELAAIERSMSDPAERHLPPLYTSAARRVLPLPAASERSRRPDLPRYGAQRFAYAAAAVLLLTTLGLSGWVHRLSDRASGMRAEIAELRAPRLNLPVVYLDSVRGEEDPASPSADEPLVLMIAPEAEREYPGYAVEIADSTGEVVWNGSGLVLSDHGTLRLGLGRRFLEAGEYRLRLYGEPAGASRERIAEYPLRLR